MSRKKSGRVDPYRQRNEQFLRTKAAEEGVKVLESGVIMKMLEEGNGDRFPKLSDIVFVQYTGRLIDGTVFDTTEGQALPAYFRVRDLIMGWQIALTRMHVGDRYEVCIPARYGYGSMRMDGIPANSTLVFDLELMKIQ